MMGWELPAQFARPFQFLPLANVVVLHLKFSMHASTSASYTSSYTEELFTLDVLPSSIASAIGNFKKLKFTGKRVGERSNGFKFL